MPKGLGGEGGNFTNPEQLFAAGYSACFDGALNLIASQRKLKINSKNFSYCWASTNRRWIKSLC
jgi:organic hydroperoxide reductase OsmC/OhrA